MVYMLLGMVFIKDVTYFDKLGVVEHKTLSSDNANSNGIVIPPYKNKNS